MDKENKIVRFNPNSPGMKKAGLFGLPFDAEDAEVVVLPVPWDVTASGWDGTANAPEAILKASKEIDLYYPGQKDAWKMGIALRDIPMEWLELNRHYRKKAKEVIGLLEDGVPLNDPELVPIAAEINTQSADLVEYVYNRSMEQLEAGKLVGVLGGDHSTPLGLINALSEKHSSFGILQIDAHADLREAYEGFTFSHASIMLNALKIESVSKLVSVGPRDLCEEEMSYIQHANGRVVGFFDEDLKQELFNGITWETICIDIVDELPEKVYVSFDIDGLSPDLCPNTGTPVPGGLSFDQAVHLLKKLIDAKKTVIGFDLCEVGNADWDANVGARILYHLCNLTGISNGRMP